VFGKGLPVKFGDIFRVRFIVYGAVLALIFIVLIYFTTKYSFMINIAGVRASVPIIPPLVFFIASLIVGFMYLRDFRDVISFIICYFAASFVIIFIVALIMFAIIAIPRGVSLLGPGEGGIPVIVYIFIFSIIVSIATSIIGFVSSGLGMLVHGLFRPREKPKPLPPPPPKVVPVKKRYCMHCGAVMPADAVVCPRCGLMPPSGADTKVCPNCGSVIPITAKYCSECGAMQPVS